MFKHELGKKGKDKITGFEGILTSACQYLTGCNRYHIQPTTLQKDGQPIEGIYFDEAQIEILGEGILPSEVQSTDEDDNGACSPDPVK